MKALKIPEATIARLSVYSRFLEQADKKGIVTTSSSEIAEGAGVSPAQVRKDLAYFGEFGTRGVGYNVKDLLRHTLKILGLNGAWNVVVIGAGNLGSALVSYRGFKERGFNIVGVFDNDLTKIGKRLVNLEVMGTEKLGQVISENDVRIGIITVPATAAQDAANMLVNAGIRAILNFAPIVLNVPNEIEMRDMDLSTRLELLTFRLCLRDLRM